MTLLISWALLSISVWIAALLVPGFTVNGWWGTIKVAALFGVCNVLLGTLIYSTIGILTLGLGFTVVFSFLARLVTNALLLKLVDAVSSSLSVRGFGSALLAALVISGAGTVLERFAH